MLPGSSGPANGRPRCADGELSDLQRLLLGRQERRCCHRCSGPRPGQPVDVGCGSAEPRSPIEVGGSGGSSDARVGYLTGRVGASVATLELHYLDSLVETVDLQSGYFLAFVAPERAIHGAATPGELVAKSQDGTVVATEDVTSFFVRDSNVEGRPRAGAARLHPCR